MIPKPTTKKRRPVTRSATKTRKAEVLKRFIADVQVLRESSRCNKNSNIKSVAAGKVDGELIISYAHEKLQGDLRIQVLFKDLGFDKPTASVSILNDSVPFILVWAVEKIKADLYTWSLNDLAAKIEGSLTEAILSARRNRAIYRNRDVIVIDDSDDEGDSNASDSSDDDYIDENVVANRPDDSGMEVDLFATPKLRFSKKRHRSRLEKYIEHDRRAVESEGYNFSILHGAANRSGGLLISISVDVARLCLSPKELLAWGLSPTVHIVLLIYVSGPYAPYEALVNDQNLQSRVSFRLGQCTKPAPTAEEAAAAFGRHDSDPPTPLQYTDLLISKNLQRHMEEFFWQVAQFKEDCGGSWEEAYGHFFQGSPDKKRKHFGSPSSKYPAETRRSLPLIAMQFALDQLERCKKYCPICYQSLADGFQAIRPVICSKPACRFQCASMDLGPSVEYEILFRPTVVDLLVSLFYTALQPVWKGVIQKYPSAIDELVLLDGTEFIGTYEWTQFDRPQFQMSVQAQCLSLKVGQWVTIHMRFDADAAMPRRPLYPDPGGNIYVAINALQSHHLEAVRYVQIISIDYTIGRVRFEASSFLFPPRGISHARLSVRTGKSAGPDASFKARVLRGILDSLPPVSQLRSHLLRHPRDDVRSVPGVTPLAATLLRWIMATNQSSITEMHPDYRLRDGSHDFAWTQFCLLQGPPEKEVRFAKKIANTAVALRDLSSEARVEHPSIFGWHGSCLQNWYGILQAGLDYTAIANGRSYGNGVYFSRAFNVSWKYSKTDASSLVFWSKTELHVKSVVSLNEIVNAPHRFVSCMPHYVLDKPSWHICRFLFVVCGALGTEAIPANNPSAIATSEFSALDMRPRWSDPPAYVVQDPQRTVFGPSHVPMKIPEICFPSSDSSRETKGAGICYAHKRRKV